MLSIGSSTVRLCDGISRREWLRAGGLGAVGLSLPQLLAAQANGATGGTFGRAKSCILLFMWGGQPHQDLYDLKPRAPVELRGEAEPIATRVPGLQLGSWIPQIANRANQFALIRSVTHPDSTHTVAMHYMMTGYRHRRPNTNPTNLPDDFPCFGAVMQKLRPSKTALPSGISLNAPGNEIPSGHIFPGYFAGFLGHNYDPMFVTDNPAEPDFQPIRTAQGISAERINRRASLLEQLDQLRRHERFDTGIETANSFYAKALSLISSPEASQAFDVRKEPQTLRERYGDSSFGQGCLVARRLVEAGVKLVTVNWGRDYQPGIADHWDTHARQFPLLRDRLCPAFDAGFSSLLDDLQDRGLLDETLVVVLGEFGRTPKINDKGGRDHWPGCNSIILAGASITGGAVYGASDGLAAYPTQDAVGPEHVAATIYHALGLPLNTPLVDHNGRPHPLCMGKPLLHLWS